jgi:hypothetical protein
VIQVKDEPVNRGQRLSFSNLSIYQQMFFSALGLGVSFALSILLGDIGPGRGIGGVILCGLVALGLFVYHGWSQSGPCEPDGEDRQRELNELLDRIERLSNQRDTLLADRLYVTLQLHDANRELRPLRNAVLEELIGNPQASKQLAQAHNAAVRIRASAHYPS